MDWDSLKQYLLVVSDAGGSADSLRQLVIRLATSGHLQQKPAEVSTWLRSKLGEIITLQYGKNLPAKKRNDQGSIPVYGSNGIVGVHDESLIDDPCIVVGRKGSSGALNVSKTPCWPTDVTYFVIPPDNIDLGFCFLMLKSLQLESLGKGIKPGLNRKEAYALEVTVPPLAEQKRIVAKVDELMALIDDLEQKQNHREEVRQKFQTAALDALVKAEGTMELEKAWERVKENWSDLSHFPNDLSSVRQTILELGVRGQLERQNESEFNSKLLQHLIDERRSLIADGKIKKPKPLKQVTGVEQLKFLQPKGWIWVRLSEVSEVVRGGSPRPAGDPRFYDGDIPFLKVADITRNTGKYVERYTYTIKEAGLRKTRFIDGETVLLSNSGATLGIPAICTFPTTFNDGIAAFLHLSRYVDKQFLYLYLKSKSSWFLDFASRGQGQPNLNTDIIRATWMPLPPLEEQKRIVAKVDDLMNLCDKLEEHLKTQEEIGNQLAEAVVAAT